MSHLKLLQQTRDARRNVARAALAQAQQACDAAEAHHAAALRALQDAMVWRVRTNRDHSLGRGGAQRDAILAACDVTVVQRLTRCQRTDRQRQEAAQALARQRQHLVQCERDSLRLEEWVGIEHQQSQARHAQREENLLNDLARPQCHTAPHSPESRAPALVRGTR